MALIKCPECGKEISDKAGYCPYCGCPSTEWLNNREKTIDSLEILNEIVYKYPNDEKNRMAGELSTRTGINYKDACKIIDNAIQQKIIEQHIPEDLKKYRDNNFSGVYRYTILGGKQEVYCPRCNSANCSHYKEQKLIPGKTKTRYSLNLNPLHPFTLFNKKEKVIRQDRIQTKNKFICNNCGLIFD